MTNLRRVAGSAIAAVAAAVLFGACSSDVDPVAVPAQQSSTTTSTADGSAPSASARTTTSSPTTTTSASAEVSLDIDTEVGECVMLGGTVDDATVDNGRCDSNSSNYKVIAIVETSSECPSDADQYYYETLRGNEMGALCLDVDWQVDGCFDFAGEDPLRIDCAAPGTETEQVTEILTGTSDVNDCSISEGGFVYDERNFVVCTDTL